MADLTPLLKIINFVLRRSYFILIFFSLFLTAKSVKAEFTPLNNDDRTSCELKLANAESILHHCEFIEDQSLPLAVWQQRLSFTFGQLSLDEFNHLKSVYGDWSRSQSEVTYSPTKSYELMDFLPPLIQALNGHRFIPESVPLTEKEQNSINKFIKFFDRQSSLNKCQSENCQPEKHLYFNCWGLVYEIWRMASGVNSPNEPILFMGQSSVIFDYFRSESQLLSRWETPEEFLRANQLMQTGDLLLIWHESKAGYQYLDHVAIVIDKGIYFEKAGAGEHVPIRMIDEETLHKTWPTGVFTYELRRMKQEVVLPESQKLFSLDSDKVQNQLLETNDLFSTNQESQNITISWEIEAKDSPSWLWFDSIAMPIIINSKNDRFQLSPSLYKKIMNK